MKKSARSLVGLAVGLSAAAVIAPSAQAASSVGWSDIHTVTSVTPGPNLENINQETSGDGTFQVVQDRSGDGWCDNGIATTGVAVRSLKGTQTLYLGYYDDNLNLVILTLPNVTTSGVVVTGLPAGFGSDPAGEEYLVSSSRATLETGYGRVSQNSVDMIAQTPNSGVILNNSDSIDYTGCYTLTKHMQSVPTDWPKPVVTTPTKPAKPSDSVTVSATATKSGVTKSTSTTAVVPVKSSVPAGGVTSTVKVTAPAQGVTATATVNPVTSTSAPVAPTSNSAATSGPKVQTDQMSNSNNTAEEALVGGMSALLLAGGATVVARRRR